MKIQGNTVGTTLKPKAALVKSENLTEEEKAIAREKIGAVSLEEILAALPNGEEVAY